MKSPNRGPSKLGPALGILLSVPPLVMLICWAAIFHNPSLGWSERLKPAFGTIFIASCGCAVVGVLRFITGARTRVDIACAAICVASIIVNGYGFLYSIGAVGHAFE